jgi:hypothetical protein
MPLALPDALRVYDDATTVATGILGALSAIALLDGEDRRRNPILRPPASESHPLIWAGQ